MVKRSHADRYTARHTGSPKRTLGAAFAVMLVIAALILTNFRLFVTSGPSMEPTYTPGQWVIAVRRSAPPEKGELVFLRYNGNYCLKRIAYCAGEDVTVFGIVPYWGSNTVPEGYVFVMGDNREDSLDSRDPRFGLVAIQDIWGMPLFPKNSLNKTNNT